MVIGTRKRKVIEIDGKVKVLIIRRLRCRKCLKIHHELPDILIPYKRHSAATYENIICGDGCDVVCEEGTIRKIRLWWAIMALHVQSILAAVEYKHNRNDDISYTAVFTALKKPTEVVRAIVNVNLWVHTRSAWLPQ